MAAPAQAAVPTPQLPWLGSGLITVAEAAKILKITKPTVYRIMERGELPWVKVGLHNRRIPMAALQAYIASNMYGQMPEMPQDQTARERIRARLRGV